MSVTAISRDWGVDPSIVRMTVTDTCAQVLATDYMLGQADNISALNSGPFEWKVGDLVAVAASDCSQILQFNGSNFNTLIPLPGGAVLPTVANRLAHFTDTEGTISGDAADVTNLGDLTLGASGTEGLLNLFPATAASGSLVVKAVDSSANVAVTISNADHAQATVVSIPDSGQATTEFILADNAGIQHITSGSLEVDAGNIIAGSDANAGYFESHPATTLSGTLRLTAVNSSVDALVTISNASHAQSSVYSIPDSGQATAEFIISDSASIQHITTGGLQIDAGAVQSGLAAGGFAGNLVLHANTTASGNFAMLAVDNATGDFDTVISNAAAVAQDQVITIPDSGAATANFLLDAGAANIIAHQQFVGISDVLTFGTGTWTVTRIAQGDYVSRHTAGDETSIIAVDITPMIRVAAAKGFRLDSFDYIYSIGTLAMDAHTVVLDRIEYANNVAVSVNSVAITGALATATQANPYVTNVAVDAPAFDITADSKYVIEITANNSATSAYDFYGIMLRFSQTIA